MIFVPSSGVNDWRSRLADPVKHWRVGYSAYATAHSWEDADGLPPEIARILGVDATMLFATPEHKVPLPGGSRDSQCDVFALARARGRLVALAVEAKVGEPFGPTVEEWFETPSAGKKERLAAICGCLGLDYPPVGHLRYQLLHRTAAAVMEARRFGADVAAMIVQSFSPTAAWFEDFKTFAELFAVDVVKDTRMTATLPGGMELVLGWASGDPKYLVERS